MKWWSLASLAGLLVLVTPLLGLPSMGCGSEGQSSWPSWVADLVEDFRSQPVTNPPRSIWQRVCRGQVVYYVPPECRDGWSTLYDSEGNVLCHPDGGITGKGDGKCGDLLEECTDPKLSWEDSRGQ